MSHYRSKKLTLGLIEDARAHINTYFPSLFADETSRKIEFLLLSQQFIELVREQDPTALDFAQAGLLHFNPELGVFSSVPEVSEMLQDVIPLIAYPNPFDSPIKHFLGQERRDQVLTAVNNHIICI